MSSLRAWLQLVRLPAVFTALADILLGFLLNHRGVDDFGPRLALLAAASACLYLSGMVFNDVFDRDVDARERPFRPIPSRRVPLRGAIALGVVLIVGGLAAAAWSGSPGLIAKPEVGVLADDAPPARAFHVWHSLWIALGIVAAIFAYNGFLKKTPLGPLGMGVCRFLNVMLGASAVDRALFLWSGRVWQLAAIMGLYIVGVAWFARYEAEPDEDPNTIDLDADGAAGNARENAAAAVPERDEAAIEARTLAFAAALKRRRRAMWGAVVVINLAIAALGGYVAWHQNGKVDPFRAWMALGLIAVILDRRLVGAILDGDPDRLQVTVKVLLWSYVMLAAIMIFHKTGDPSLSFATLALLVPAILLGRWIYIT